ncbi:MAG: hypothetical protein KGL74_09025 [Elusimicrobia bacterium]|nr:hypothetical protein [Elusimicrobiota bacterium]MDE2511251.1 hypothetical protein [Elusimicrobiota bacterium]
MSRNPPPEPGLPVEKLLLVAGLGVGVIVFLWGFAALLRHKAPVATAPEETAPAAPRRTIPPLPRPIGPDGTPDNGPTPPLPARP